MKDILKFTIELNPVTKKNSQEIAYNRRTGRPFVKQSDIYKRYAAECGYYIQGRGMNIDFPVQVTTVFYRRTRHTVDLTNLEAAIHDILVSYEVIKDDSYKIIVSTDGSRVMFDKDHPRTEVTISKWEGRV